MRAAAVAYKDQLHAYFATYAEAAGAENPALLAEQLVMLFDGAMTRPRCGVCVPGQRSIRPPGC
ncbi:hypothetical protein E4K10_05425 [Streptomyces sp. T1317-0309]|nr:hypothetical protein E4K10_05425 [Streptomyces sp. T1317-0309]